MTVSAAIPAVERILLTLWVGGMWTTGLILAPVLFSNYPRSVAGEIAGRLFEMTSYLGIVCAVALLVLAAIRIRRRLWRDARVAVLVAMLAIVLIGEFGIATQLRQMREPAMQETPGSELRVAFGRLHGFAGALFLVNAMLGLTLVVAGPRPRRNQAGS